MEAGHEESEATPTRAVMHQTIASTKQWQPSLTCSGNCTTLGNTMVADRRVLLSSKSCTATSKRHSWSIRGKKKNMHDHRYPLPSQCSLALRMAIALEFQGFLRSITHHWRPLEH